MKKNLKKLLLLLFEVVLIVIFVLHIKYEKNNMNMGSDRNVTKLTTYYEKTAVNPNEIGTISRTSKKEESTTTTSITKVPASAQNIIINIDNQNDKSITRATTSAKDSIKNEKDEHKGELKQHTSIIGKWVRQTKNVLGIPTEIEISFYENGNGFLSTILDFGITFDYSIKDNNITIIPNPHLLKKTRVYEFEVNGDELIFFDDDDKRTFTRIK